MAKMVEVVIKETVVIREVHSLDTAQGGSYLEQSAEGRCISADEDVLQ